MNPTNPTNPTNQIKPLQKIYDQEILGINFAKWTGRQLVQAQKTDDQLELINILVKQSIAPNMLHKLAQLSPQELKYVLTYMRKVSLSDVLKDEATCSSDTCDIIHSFEAPLDDIMTFTEGTYNCVVLNSTYSLKKLGQFDVTDIFQILSKGISHIDGKELKEKEILNVIENLDAQEFTKLAKAWVEESCKFNISFVFDCPCGHETELDYSAGMPGFLDV